MPGTEMGASEEKAVMAEVPTGDQSVAGRKSTTKAAVDGERGIESEKREPTRLAVRRRLPFAEKREQDVDVKRTSTLLSIRDEIESRFEDREGQ